MSFRDAKLLAQKLGDVWVDDPMLHALISSVRSGMPLFDALVGSIQMLAAERREHIKRETDRLRRKAPVYFIAAPDTAGGGDPDEGWTKNADGTLSRPCSPAVRETVLKIGRAFPSPEKPEPPKLPLGHPYQDCDEPDYAGGCRNSGCHYRAGSCGQPSSAHESP
jgi:hypothetical protein